MRGEYRRFPSVFLSHSAEKFRSGTLLCFRPFWVLKNFMPRTGMSRFAEEKLLSHSAEKFCRGTFVFIRVLGLKKSCMPKRGISRFSMENLLSHSAGKFVGEPFYVSKNFDIEKIYGEEGEGVSRLSVRGLVSHKAKKFLFWNHLACHYFWVAINFTLERGSSRFAVKFFCLEEPKSFVGESFCAFLKRNCR